MPSIERTWRRQTPDDHRTKAEDAGYVLALVVIAVLGMTLVTILLLRFLEVLPVGIDLIVFMSIVAFGAVVGRAILSRTLSLPPVYRGRVPSVRNR